MMRKDSEQDDQGFNTPFDQWLRDNEPPGPAYTRDVESSLEGFRAKMKAEKVARAAWMKKRLVQGSVTMCVVLLSVGIFNMTDVGGDGFWMAEVEVEDAETTGRVMRNEFRGDGFNAFERDSDQKIRGINESVSADEGVAIGIEGWLIKGKTYWNIWREHLVMGESRIIASLSKNPETPISRDFGVFLTMQWEGLEKGIQTGDKLPNEDQTLQKVDGITFRVSTWVLETPEGQILYYKGDPIR